MRRVCRTLLAVAALVLPQAALAGGGNYTVDGGTASQRAQVRAALEASTFDWGLVPAVAIHVVPAGATYATPGEITIDGRVLDQGRFGWATLQHEYAHQVDFFVLDDAKRASLNTLLGGRDWCYSVAGLAHADYGCERFASTLAWSYWPSPENALRPVSPRDESAAVPPAQFRALLAQLLGVPRVASAPRTVKAFAPPSSRNAALEP